MTFDRDIVRLPGARCAAAIGDEFFEQCFHLGDFFRHRCGEVRRFRDIVGEVVKLDGLRLVAALAPVTGTRRGDVLPKQ